MESWPRRHGTLFTNSVLVGSSRKKSPSITAQHSSPCLKVIYCQWKNNFFRNFLDKNDLSWAVTASTPRIFVMISSKDKSEGFSWNQTIFSQESHRLDILPISLDCNSSSDSHSNRFISPCLPILFWKSFLFKWPIKCKYSAFRARDFELTFETTRLCDCTMKQSRCFWWAQKWFDAPRSCRLPKDCYIIGITTVAFNILFDPFQTANMIE